MSIKKIKSLDDLFEDLKSEVLKVDPVSFAKDKLRIDGKPLDLHKGTGWSYLADIYRYIGTTALSKNGKPIVCVKGRQTGATTMATALELYFTTSGLFGTSSKSPIRIIHCFPALALVQKFAKDKLSTMMRTSKDDYVQKKSLSYDEETGKKRQDVPEDTLTEKQFSGENRIWIESNANDAQRLHGMSVDAIFYDEVQRMDRDDIGNSKRTLTAARYGPINMGIQLYFGTPLRKGSDFYKMWEASDKRFYHLGCALCNGYFKLYELESDSWEKVWLYENIVECPHCKHQQDKVEAVDRGKWIPSQPTYADGTEPPYVGFHFNQMLIPNFKKETILNEKPGIHPTNSERIWKCEILGEFYSGTDLPMSEEEIKMYCKNTNRSISFGTPRPKNFGSALALPQAPAFMGVDWGGKTDTEGSAGKSYSSVVVASLSGDVLQIENAFKLKNNAFDHKKEVINEMYRRFDIKYAVADLGYGSDIVPEIQKEYGERFIGCLSSGSLINPAKYDPEELRMIINPHQLLEELFGSMRKSKIMFPWKSYEQIYWLIEHCCSMEKKSSTVQGRVVNRYVKGHGPNDGLMSLLYAYLAYKFYLTKGFSVKPHQIGVSSTAPILAYAPGI